MRKETEERARCRSDEDASQSSEHDLSADPGSNEDDTEVQVETVTTGMMRCRIPWTRGIDRVRWGKTPRRGKTPRHDITDLKLFGGNFFCSNLHTICGQHTGKKIMFLLFLVREI